MNTKLGEEWTKYVVINDDTTYIDFDEGKLYQVTGKDYSMKSDATFTLTNMRLSEIVQYSQERIEPY